MRFVSAGAHLSDDRIKTTPINKIDVALLRATSDKPRDLVYHLIKQGLSICAMSLHDFQAQTVIDILSGPFLVRFRL